jgi:hypothetical protein
MARPAQQLIVAEVKRLTVIVPDLNDVIRYDITTARYVMWMIRRLAHRSEPGQQLLSDRNVSFVLINIGSDMS